jgi:hypothetical protein
MHHCTRDLQKFLHFHIFKENGGGVIVGCHMTSWQGQPVDLAVSVRVATKQLTRQRNLRIAPRRVNDLLYVFGGQKVYQVDKFISAGVLSLGTMLSLL